MYRYNGGEGFVPGSMFRKFDRRQGTAYVKNVSLFHRLYSNVCIISLVPSQFMLKSIVSLS